MKQITEKKWGQLHWEQQKQLYHQESCVRAKNTTVWDQAEATTTPQRNKNDLPLQVRTGLDWTGLCLGSKVVGILGEEERWLPGHPSSNDWQGNCFAWATSIIDFARRINRVKEEPKAVADLFWVLAVFFGLFPFSCWRGVMRLWELSKNMLEWEEVVGSTTRDEQKAIIEARNQGNPVNKGPHDPIFCVDHHKDEIWNDTVIFFSLYIFLSTGSRSG